MLTVVILPQDVIEKIFSITEQSPEPHQSQWFMMLFRFVFPRFHDIEVINQFPVVSPKTSEFLFRYAIEFDKTHHPDVFAGGMWMNSGFATQKNYADWCVGYDPDDIVWK